MPDFKKEREHLLAVIEEARRLREETEQLRQKSREIREQIEKVRPARKTRPQKCEIAAADGETTVGNE